MGTRSLTYCYETFKDGDKVRNEPIVCMYRQFDGYLEGHGTDLAKFLAGMKIVNGLGAGTDVDNGGLANGMGCLSAQLVAHFKKEPGNFYLHAPILNRDDWQEFEYHVFDDKVIVYSIGSNNDNVLFEGDYQAFAKFCGVEGFEKQPDLKEALHNGEVVVTFTKTDGSERVMRCTLNEGKIPQANQVKTSGSTRAVNPDVQPVFDLDAQHWKSFRWDSLIKYEVV